MNDDLDVLLREDLLQPPPDFAQRVMKSLPLSSPKRDGRILANAGPAAQPAMWHRLRRLMGGAVMVSGAVFGSVVGLFQLASYVFGVWLSAAAL